MSDEKKDEPAIVIEDAPARTPSSPQDMAQAMAMDRGCCFLAFYHAAKHLRPFQRTTILCEECRLEWLMERIGELGLQIFPIGLKPLVEVVSKLKSVH